MPYLTLIIPSIPAESKDAFLAAWPTVAAQMKAQPGVKGISAGPIVAADGQAVTDFQFLQCLAFETLEDENAFFTGTFIQSHVANYQAKATGQTIKAIFQVPSFPTDAKPKKFTQFSRITLSSEEKRAEVRKAWEALTGLLGKETWGGVSIETGEGPSVGLGMLGWDSIEETAAAFKDLKVIAAKEQWESLGIAKNVLVQMDTY